LGLININFFLDQNISSWFRRSLACGNKHVFLAACWWIWRTRNNLCLANKNTSLYEVKLQVYTTASINSRVFASHSMKLDIEQLVAWHPDEQSAIILNVDGSSLGNPGPSGFGGVLRHSNGDWIFGFVGTVGISTILHVELLAIYNGLKVAWDQGHRNIICYSDSTLSLQLIDGKVNPWHHYASILANITELVKRNWSICFRHTKREANSVADFLAKTGAAGTSNWTEMRTPPPAAIPLLQSRC
jgi:ribonuclease HI